MSDRKIIYLDDAIDALTDYIHNIDKAIGTGRLSPYDCKDAATNVLADLPSAQPEQSRIEKELHGLTPEQQYRFLRELMYEKATAWNCSALYIIAWLKGEED